MHSIPASAPRSQPDTWATLPARIRDRLEREGLGTPAAWRAAGRRRFECWGVTAAWVRKIDALARGRE